MITPIETLPKLYALGHELDTSGTKFGFLRPSADRVDDVQELRRRMDEDGYLYIPGFFSRDRILEARKSLTDRLQEQHLLHPDYPALDAVLAPGAQTGFKPDLARHNRVIESLIYGPELLGFYQDFLGGKVLHYDFTWVRAMGTGHGTAPHADIVYMGRGTSKLCTCWVPYGDVPLEVGGLMILENSHRKGDLLRPYLQKDVDAYCVNRPKDAKLAAEGKWSWPGWLTNNPVSLQEKLGGRWLTAEWKMGDFVTFKSCTVHGSLDNQTTRIRLSTDSRYQLASEAADERWIGENPVGHSAAGKLGRVC